MDSPDERSTRVEHELFVRSFFPVNPPAHVTTQLGSSMRDLSFAPGEILFEAGAPADRIYFILEGEVHLKTKNQEPWVFGEHAMIGILDAVLNRPHARQAVATSEVRGLVVRSSDYFDVMEENFEFYKNVIKLAYNGLHQTALQLAPDHVFPSLSEQSQTGYVPFNIEQRPLNTVEKLLVLSSTRIIREPPIQALASLAHHAVEERWKPKDVILEAGTPWTALHLVAAGKVDVRRETPVVRATFGPGGLLGGHAALGSDSSDYRMEAQTHAVTLRIEKEDLYDAMEDHDGLAKAISGFIAIERERVMTALAERRSAEPAPPAP